MKTYLRTTLVSVGLLAASASAQADHNLWMGVKAGTLGLGVEAAWRPIPWFDLRLGLNQFDYDETGSEAGVNYDADLALDTFYGTANFRFPMSPMRFTVGAFSNGNELLLTSQEAPTIEIGGVVYPGDAVGTLRGRTAFDSTAPYVGVGFDFDLADKIGLNLDLGVLWQGEPGVSLEADGILGSDPLFLERLEAERQELEAEMEDYKAWPVVSLGLAYKFR